MNKKINSTPDKKDPSKLNELLIDRDFNLWAMIAATRSALILARERELESYGISHVEASVLWTIQVIEELIDKEPTVGEVARSLFKRPHTASELINRMEKKGLVTKVNGTRGRNTKKVMLTEKGLKAYQDSAKRVSVYNIISALSENERKQLWKCLGKLRKKAVAELGAITDVPYPETIGAR